MRLPRHEFTRKDFRGVRDIQTSCQIWCIVQRLREIGCLIHDQRNTGRLVRCRIRREGEIFNAFYDKDLVCFVRHVIFVYCHGQCITLHANGIASVSLPAYATIAGRCTTERTFLCVDAPIIIRVRTLSIVHRSSDTRINFIE